MKEVETTQDTCKREALTKGKGKNEGQGQGSPKGR